MNKRLLLLGLIAVLVLAVAAPALAKRGVAHAYVPFEGEQHGFRRAENICTALDRELYFYSRVFDFEVDVHPEAGRIVPGRGIPDGRL